MKLTWIVNKTIPTSCPDYTPDTYTGEYPSMQCLVYHCKTVTEHKEFDFETREEAEKFTEQAPYSCSEFRLDGKLLEDKRPKQEPSSFTYSSNLLNIE